MTRALSFETMGSQTASGGSAGADVQTRWATAIDAPPRREARRAVQRDYRLLSALFFLVFLVVATAARLMPRSWRVRICGYDGPRSIVADARAMVGATIAIAFSA